MDSNDRFLLRDDAPRDAVAVEEFLAKKNVTVLNRPPYSPDLATVDHLPFPESQYRSMVPRFDFIEDTRIDVTRASSMVFRYLISTMELGSTVPHGA